MADARPVDVERMAGAMRDSRNDPVAILDLDRELLCSPWSVIGRGGVEEGTHSSQEIKADPTSTPDSGGRYTYPVAAGQSPAERVQALFAALADKDGSVGTAIMLRLLEELGNITHLDGPQTEELEHVLGPTGKKTVADIVAGPVGGFLSMDSEESATKLDNLERAAAEAFGEGKTAEERENADPGSVAGGGRREETLLILAARRCIPLLQRFLTETAKEKGRRSAPNVWADDPYFQSVANPTLLHALCDVDPATETAEAAAARCKVLTEILSYYSAPPGNGKDMDTRCGHTDCTPKLKRNTCAPGLRPNAQCSRHAFPLFHVPIRASTTQLEVC